MLHHYRTRSKTATETGRGTSSANMEAKGIANDDFDAFNNIPSSIIEHILSLVPIKDAGRTSILSRNWRYRWTKIPKLVFDLRNMVDDEDQLEQLFGDWSIERKDLMMRCKQFFVVYQALCMHRGPILDFSFSMSEPLPDDACFEVEQMIIHLARTSNNNVKKFTLNITYDDISFNEYELPRSIFLLRHLTDLHIENCTLDVVPTLAGFGSLTSLFFLSGSFSNAPLLHLLANCPVLKKLELSLDLGGVSHSLSIVELLKCLPVIEDLSICQWIIQGSDVPPVPPIALVHLKRFHLTYMRLLDTYGLEFLFLVMRSSPNLEKIELHIYDDDYCGGFKDGEDFGRSDALKDSSDIWLEHLKEMEIIDFANMEHEMKFVKLILATAPVLKKVMIDLCFNIERDQKLKIKRNFKSSPRVSPFAEIIVYGGKF